MTTRLGQSIFKTAAFVGCSRSAVVKRKKVKPSLEEGGLVWWIKFSLILCGCCVHVCCLPGEHMASRCIMGRRQAGRDSVMLWAVFCWESLGPVIPVDVTLTRTTYLRIVADHVYPFMETIFPAGCGLFQQDNAPCHKAKMVWGAQQRAWGVDLAS